MRKGLTDGAVGLVYRRLVDMGEERYTWGKGERYTDRALVTEEDW